MNVKTDIILAAALSVASLAVSAKPRVVVVNEDNDHYFKLDASLMTEQALKDYVDKMAGGKVTHFFMCPSGQRTSYDSKVWDRIWDEYDPKLHGRNRHFASWATNAKSLCDRGIDPYAVWIRRCREKGISPWLSPRMNDAHNSNEKNPWRSTTFWRTRDDLHCYPGERSRDWTRCTLNFAYDEVQDYTFALVKEQLDRYDVDGIELDFYRFSEYFPRETAYESAHHLDRFVKRVKDYVDVKTKERGHRVLLGVRCSTTPKTARAKGLDVGKWVREGWVDWVTGSTYWDSPDLNMPVGEWRTLFGKRADEVMLLNGTDHGVCANRGNKATKRLTMTAELYAGFADIVWSSGADGVYLFNVPYVPEELEKVCARGLFPADLPAQERRYPISFRSEAAAGVPCDVQLPRKNDKPVELTVRVGGKVSGAQAFVRIAWREEGDFEPELTLNGVKATASVAEPMKGRCDAWPDNSYEYRSRLYAVPVSAVRPGNANKVVIGATVTPATVIWTEIVMK